MILFILNHFSRLSKWSIFFYSRHPTNSWSRDKVCESLRVSLNVFLYAWDIPTMKCGDYSIYYLQSSGNCGRYCLGNHRYWYFHAQTLRHFCKSQIFYGGHLVFVFIISSFHFYFQTMQLEKKTQDNELYYTS